MSSSNKNPKWWQLYLTFPLLIALFTVDNHLKISTREHQAAQIGIVLLIFGIIHLWLKANSSTLSKMDQRQYRGTFTVLEIPPYQSDETDRERHPLIRLSDSEIKGMLNDTFEMDYPDAESFTTEAYRRN